MSLQKTILIFLLGLTPYFHVTAQQKPQSAAEARDAICQKVICRESKTVSLKLGNKKVISFDFPKTPYVAEGYINVLTGEEINVEFDENANTLINARYVERVKSAAKTIVFKLSQTEDGTVLSVNNPFSKDIIYDCLIQNYKTEKLQKTSIIPVGSKLLSFEMWAEPIPQILISNVRFVAEK